MACRSGSLLLAAALLALSTGAYADETARPERFFVYNLTSTSNLNGIYLAPAGTTEWGANQALNDKDHQVEPTERLLVKGIGHGVYDVRAVTTTGHECIKKSVDLTHDTSFDIRDADLSCP